MDLSLPEPAELPRSQSPFTAGVPKPRISSNVVRQLSSSRSIRPKARRKNAPSLARKARRSRRPSALAGSMPAMRPLYQARVSAICSRADQVNGPTPDPRRAIYQRTAADYAGLRAYAGTLNADIIAVQEVDGTDALAKVFDPARYQLFLTDEDDFQRPGLVVRKGLKVTRHPDLAELDVLAGQPRSLRRGLDMTVHLPAGDIRVLVVHMKGGCFDDGRKGEACEQLAQQIPVLGAWIDARQAEGGDFVILGDFNRRMGKTGDSVWRQLDNGPSPLVLATAGMQSPCWGGEYPDLIDHLIFGNGASRRVRPESPAILVYTETDKAAKARLSDHCPVSVTLR